MVEADKFSIMSGHMQDGVEIIFPNGMIGKMKNDFYGWELRNIISGDLIIPPTQFAGQFACRLYKLSDKQKEAQYENSNAQ